MYVRGMVVQWFKMWIFTVFSERVLQNQNTLKRKT